MELTRCGIYVRVSTQEQSTEAQERELIEYAEHRQWQIARVYEDMATGTNAKRARLNEMLNAARARQLDVILVWKLDRFFRSLKDMVMTLQELADLGVAFVSLKDPLVDMSTNHGRLMTHLIAAFGEFEASLIRERVVSGLKNARAKGRRLGRPPVGFEIRRQIAEMKSKGLSNIQIAAKLKLSPSTISRILTSICPD